MTFSTNASAPWLAAAIHSVVVATASGAHAQASGADTQAPPAAAGAADEATVDNPPVGATVVGASSGENGDTTTAASVFWEGKRLYDEGQFDQARERFEQAYRLVHDPTLLYNIGQSYRQLGDCPKAKSAYLQFRDKAPDSPLAARAREHLAELERVCPSEPPTQTVPRAATVQPHTTTDAPGAAPTTTAFSRASESSSLPPKSRDLGGYTYLAWGTLAAGAIAGATATGLWIWNRDRYRSWQSHDASLAKGTAPGESPQQWAVRQQTNDELGDSVRRSDRLGAYVGVASGALLVGSALLFFATPKPSSESASFHTPKPRTWSVGTHLAPNDLYLSVRTAF